MPLGGKVTLLLVVAAVALLAALGLHHSCVDSPPPISGPPESGTPRAGYCDATDHGLWPLPLIAVLLMAAALPLWRRNPWLVWIALALVLAAVVFVGSYAGTLDAADTI